MHPGSLRPAKGAVRTTKRLGRGLGSGQGGTAGRGHKGQRSRGKGKIRLGFEGGQMPLFRRIPKFGFHNLFRIEYQVVNISQLGDFAAGTTIDKSALVKAGLLKKVSDRVKVLGDGDLSKKLTVRAERFSKSAKEKITAAGGSALEVQGSK
ncbi:MAG: 50S ribosomal protein L15 [Planctomycetes bacterium]|nr:50S ribosomal protein L15 [Planctomycetota bacterium]